MSHKKGYFLSFFRLSAKFIFCIFSIYLLILAIGGYFWTINPKEIKNQSEDEIEIYITSNGLHTDIVIPIQKNQVFFKTLGQDSIINSYLQNSYTWLSIGWGDKQFFNESYDNKFPSISSCLNAALLPSETLMHINFYRNNLEENEVCKKIKLKKEEYQNLLQHIEGSFRTVNEDSEDKINQTKFSRLPQKGYSTSDYFFEANGSYHLFYTCNSWTNEGLQKANQKTAYFAPLAQTVFYHLN